MPVRITMKFKLNTIFNTTSFRTRHATWQERVYSALNDPYEAARIVQEGAGPPGGGLLVKRAALLGRQAYIDGFTAQPFTVFEGVGEVATGNAISFGDSSYGPVGAVTDYPQSAILVSFGLQGGRGQRPRFPIRGVPEAQTITGEWDNQDRPYKTAVMAYLQEVAIGYGTYVDETVGAAYSPRRIDSITAAGVVTYLGEAGPFNVDNLVKITRTTVVSGRRTGGVYRITAADGDARTFTIDRTPGVSSTGGTARIWGRVFAGFASGSGVIVRAMTKKTGGVRDYRGQNRSNRV